VIMDIAEPSSSKPTPREAAIPDIELMEETNPPSVPLPLLSV
jgi:hypothetical protein